MNPKWSIVGVGIIITGAVQAVQQPTASDLIAKYASNQDKLLSWTIKSEHTVAYHANFRQGQSTQTYDIRFDGKRLNIRSHTWGDAYQTGKLVPKNEVLYQSRSWDGSRHVNYFRRSDSNDRGTVIVTPNPPDNHIKDLYSNSGFLPVMGFYHPGIYERIDTIFRRARSVSLRNEREQVNGVECVAIDATSESGDYTVWITPEHECSIARVRVERSAAKGHIWLERPMTGGRVVCTTTNLRFGNVDGTWVPIESDMVCLSIDSMGNQETETSHVVVTEIIARPDHEALRSFDFTDIPNGTYCSLYPILHIGYTWQDGDLMPRFDDHVVAKIDTVLSTVTALGGVSTDAFEADMAGLAKGGGVKLESADLLANATGPKDSSAVPAQPHTVPYLGPRPHCGLYCLYSFLKLAGREVKYPDLVKPEYYGSHEGSSLANLHRLAKDYGLYAEVVRRLSVWALQDAPCQAVLHVRPDSQAREYNHYALFLGLEKGKVRLFDPPEGLRLVDFTEFAYLWDGSALLISSQPFDVDSICSNDRQRLLLCWGSGMLVCLALYIGRLIWSRIMGAVPRRWAMGLTLGQAAMMVLAAFIFAVLYHLCNDEALLANGTATASIQKAYRGAFIPRISQSTVRSLLQGDTVFIDARMARDYGMGHFDRAISLPVDANDVLWKKTTASIPGGKPIMVYCQSAGCKFAEKVGAKLIEEGFRDISIYRGGWNDWTAKDRDRGKKTQ